MNSTPYFSLILPIYNVEKYIHRCIDSIQKQSFDDYEVILVDDGSKDSCPDICERYSDEQGYKIIHKQNGGLSSARNAGLEVAAGKYVFWIDSDDWIEESALLCLHNAICDKNVDIVKFNYYRQPQNSKVCAQIETGLYEKAKIESEMIPFVLEKTGEANFSAWSHVYKKDFLVNNNLHFVSEREIGSEDYLFNLQAYLCADTILSIEDCIYNYDMREGSLTQRYRKNLIEQYHNLHKYFKQTLSEQNVYERYQSSYAYSYVDKALVVCIQNECKKTSEHDLFEGWKNSRALLKYPAFRDALKTYPDNNVSHNAKLKLIFMRYYMAVPLMLMMIKGLHKARKKYK